MTEDLTIEIPDRRAAHWRLSDETWAMIMAEYRAGATAPELSAKWRVSEHAIRKRVTLTGSSKRKHGDACAAEQAKAWHASRAEARQAFERRVRALFVTEGETAEDTDVPGRLSRQAMQAAGRAMRAGLWEEARTLLAFGGEFQKVAAQEAGRMDATLESLPLRGVMAARMASDERVQALFHLSDRPGVKDPDRDTKQIYWRFFRNDRRIYDIVADISAHRSQHIEALKGFIERLGHTPPAYDYPTHTLEVETDDEAPLGGRRA